uniref:Uncharacterized protein LOC104223384 n=1 Tax=Nicotiana sylvestris TaxID=4096 RepID=A0A1U7WFU8_NICSY|nr:PREDICTED: uncharacterized protein LOC104223384 [Nicotiana sylvestris]
MLYKDDGVLISQRKFTTNLLKEYDCMGYSAVSSPRDSSTKLKAEEGPLMSDPYYYRKLVGKLNFLTNTRLDIAYSVQHLSQFMQAPREPHLKAAIHVLRRGRGGRLRSLGFARGGSSSAGSSIPSSSSGTPSRIRGSFTQKSSSKGFLIRGISAEAVAASRTSTGAQLTLRKAQDILVKRKTAEEDSEEEDKNGSLIKSKG